MNSFDKALADAGTPLTRTTPRILQLNLGKLCNLTCVHCHVNAGPHRKELIKSEALEKTLDWFEASGIPVIGRTCAFIQKAA